MQNFTKLHQQPLIDDFKTIFCCSILLVSDSYLNPGKFPALI